MFVSRSTMNPRVDPPWRGARAAMWRGSRHHDSCQENNGQQQGLRASERRHFRWSTRIKHYSLQRTLAARRTSPQDSPPSPTNDPYLGSDQLCTLTRHNASACATKPGLHQPSLSLVANTLTSPPIRRIPVHGIIAISKTQPHGASIASLPTLASAPKQQRQRHSVAAYATLAT